MSELPAVCRFCYEETMIDMDNLERRKIDKIKSALGFACPKCGGWNEFFKTTTSLDKAFDKLEKKNPDSATYSWHFARTMKKAEGVQE